MGYDRVWERLIEALDDGSSVVEVAPGRVAVTISGPGEPARVAEIVMTRREWDDMATVVWGDADNAIDYVRRLVRDLGPEERFLVYETYDLVPSTTAELPADPDEAILEALLRKRPEGSLRWAALDHEGNVLDEFPPR